MTSPLAPDAALGKAYEPTAIADALYAEWQKSGAWHANPHSPKAAKKDGTYAIVMPPPNITGVLTMGHVLNNTIQDILVRHARMQGKEALWLPGTDHAGLATQTVVEKHLKKTEGKTRQQLGREEFLSRVVQWQDKHGSIIIEQLKKLGCSADWQRTCYTMDEGYSRAVLEVFVDLHRKGLIYRGKRMVNWCPGSRTAISDEEVIPKTIKSVLYYVKYALADDPSQFLTVATTRPETIMADVAIAVNPEDPRYKKFIGKKVRRSLAPEEIPVIADAAVDVEFGTGALKVTPAHDRTDFEIGQRHNLPVIDVLTETGKIDCPAEDALHGLDRFDARKKAAELLRERGLLEKEEPYESTVGYSERADVPIEPRLSEQWFLRYPKIKESLDVVCGAGQDRQIRFWPSHWTKVYAHWLENIQDWCISRQVWWGHRIPVWYKDGETRCQIDSPGAGWEQDPDTLDTWFSSWLWAYATMDGPLQKKFYPTSCLVTGPDIIFLWVARMIIAGLEFEPSGTSRTDLNIPFRDVYFTGIIRDAQGRKMSKSLGNSPDPLDLIAKYGADGLRFGLMRIAPQGQDIRFDEKQVEEGRNFCNKLWNACRLRTAQLEPLNPNANPFDAKLHQRTIFADAVLERMNVALGGVNSALEAYEFSEAAQRLYHFVWNDFCSEFLEAAKVDWTDATSPTRSGTLATCDYILSRILRLLHPFAPFITEQLWHSLKFGTETIQFEPWPTLPDPISGNETVSVKAAQPGRDCYAVVIAGRQLRGQFNLSPGKKLRFLLRANEAAAKLGAGDRKTLEALLGAERLEWIDQAPARCPVAFTPLGELYLPLEGVVDPAAERARVEKQLAKLDQDLALTRRKLSDEKMLAHAPPEKVQGWRELEAALTSQRAQLEEQLGAL